MFGSLGFNEILFIMVLALLVFGPKRLPQIGRTIGKTMGEFRRATDDLKRSMQVEMSAAEKRDTAGTVPSPRLVESAEPRRDSVAEIVSEAPAAEDDVDSAASSEDGDDTAPTN